MQNDFRRISKSDLLLGLRVAGNNHSPLPDKISKYFVVCKIVVNIKKY